MTRILTDDDLTAPSLMPAAIAAVEAGMRSRAAGTLVSPPRHAVRLGDRGHLVFTIGGSLAMPALAGFRVYDTLEGSAGDQLVAVWSLETAQLECVVLGARLGEIRTGAIGGVAIRHMSKPDAHIVGIIGSGRQARMQLEAAVAVRRVNSVRVYSRNPARCRDFAETMSRRLDLSIAPAGTAKEAVVDAEIVICATTSTTPVLDASWLRPDAHLTTVGPKTRDGHEIGLDVADWAAVVATDAPEQVCSYGTPFFLDGWTRRDEVADLSVFAAGARKARLSGFESTLFCSAGLAGTEVLVASALLPLIAA